MKTLPETPSRFRIEIESFFGIKPDPQVSTASRRIFNQLHSNRKMQGEFQESNKISTLPLSNSVANDPSLNHHTASPASTNANPNLHYLNYSPPSNPPNQATALSTIESTCNAEFHLFPSLPIELRLKNMGTCRYGAADSGRKGSQHQRACPVRRRVTMLESRNKADRYCSPLPIAENVQGVTERGAEVEIGY